MDTIIGIFPTRQAALEAAHAARATGIADDQLTLIEPHSSLVETTSLSPPQPDAPGSCGANTENVQGAILGFAGGLLGSTILVLALPGIGPIAAVGALGLSGAMGSLAGGIVGQAGHEAKPTELTPQEFLTYEFALQTGKFLLVLQPSNESTAQTMNWVLSQHGAEDFARVQDQWWRSLRAQEREGNEGAAETLTDGERQYREGFEAAITEYGRQSTCNGAEPADQAQDSAASQEEAFKRGYVKGRLYYEAMLRRYAQKNEQSASVEG